jgi:two-component system, NtrC family, sensor kinase
MNQLWLAIGTGGCVALVLYLIFHGKFLSLRRQLAIASEQVELCQHERDLAQQELVQRLERERSLEQEKLQFDSQLSDFEKYASLAQLALGAAHEINNPLLGIMSHLELELRSADGEQREEIQQCIEGVRRISSAIRGLMDYARPDPLTLSRVDLHFLTTQTVEFLAHQPLFNRLELHNCIPSDLPEIIADQNQISQVLTNLLLNAAQATPPGGSITVTAETAKAGFAVELRVRDTGTGVPPDILPHVFEPFFTTKRGTGTGLGLSITRNYVLRHGGDIQMQSVPGSGTTVRVTLPLRHALQLKPELEEVVA